MPDKNAPTRAHMTRLAPVWNEWQSRVPEVLATCEKKWGLDVVELLARRVGSSLYRVQVRGREAVLKLGSPGEYLAQQADVLEAAKGRGYVHIYDRDDERGALLIEALGPSLQARAGQLYGGIPSALVLPLVVGNELVPKVVRSLQEAWQVPIETVPAVDHQSHKASQLRNIIVDLADELGVRSAHEAAIERALLYAEQRLSVRSAATEVLCHGDPHVGNLLEVTSPRPGANSGYVFIDPDGVRCEPEYDLGVVLRGFNSLVLAAEDPVVEVRSWCAALASLADLDAEAVWQWALLERVASGLYLINQGWAVRGARYLDAATWLITRKGR